MMRLMCMALLLSTAGCAMMGSSVPGGVSVSKSNYDGSTEVYMNPGWAHIETADTLKIGARKTSNMRPEKVLLIVRNDMIRHFSASHPNFLIKMDGKEIGLSPTTAMSECLVSTSSDVAHCYQEYEIDLSIFKSMVGSSDVRFKLLLRDNQFVEGGLLHSGTSTAKSGMTKFAEEIQKLFPVAIGSQTPPEKRKPSGK